MSRYITTEAMQGYTQVINMALTATAKNPGRPVRIVCPDERAQVQIASVLKAAGRIAGECRWNVTANHNEDMDLLGLNGEWPDEFDRPANYTNTVWLFVSDFRKERKKVQA